MAKELNGWNLEAMTEAIDGLKEHPEAGKVTWRDRVTWDTGFGLDVRTERMIQLDQAITRPFTLRGDHPPELLGQNTGPTAVEVLMAALGACMTGTFAAQATARGVTIESLEVDMEGENDLNGFFGLKPVSPKLSDVKLTFHVESDADSETLEEILEAAQSLSPVFNSVTEPVEVEATIAQS
jgi:uncharacterized OsmC-like protein